MPWKATDNTKPASKCSSFFNKLVLKADEMVSQNEENIQKNYFSLLFEAQLQANFDASEFCFAARVNDSLSGMLLAAIWIIQVSLQSWLFTNGCMR